MAKGSGSAGRGGGAGGGGVSGAALENASLSDFANVAQRVANAKPNELIDYKSLVSDVWGELRSRGSTISLDQFKGRLIAANQQGLIRLSRADLAYALPRQAAVQSSRITHLSSQFHFIDRT